MEFEEAYTTITQAAGAELARFLGQDVEIIPPDDQLQAAHTLAEMYASRAGRPAPTRAEVERMLRRTKLDAVGVAMGWGGLEDDE